MEFYLNLESPAAKFPFFAKNFKNFTSLQKIVLNLNIGEELRPYGYNLLPPLVTVRSVKLLVGCFSTRGLNNHFLMANTFTIMRLFPNAQSLSCPDPIVCLVILRHREQKYLPLPNLKKIDIKLKAYPPEVTMTVLEKLGGMKTGLESLNVEISTFSREYSIGILSSLEDVLTHHKLTLKSLRVKIYNSTSEQLNLSSFPQLQKLELWMNEPDKGSEIPFIFPPGNFYATHFPKLEELRVYEFPSFCSSQENSFDVFTSFLIPTTEQYLKMKRVEFSVPTGHRKRIEEYEWKFLHAFPHASRSFQENLPCFTTNQRNYQ